METTLFDIFYSKKWYELPDHSSYNTVLEEMQQCAVKYALDIKTNCVDWKRVIEDETRELCRQNHFVLFLSAEKKKWHNTVRADFLLCVKKAMGHYGFDFKELPKNTQLHYGIEYYSKSKPESPEQAILQSNKQPEKSTASRGRKITPFKDLVTNDTDGSKLKKLHNAMKEKKGKAAALIMYVAVESGIIIKPTYTQVYREFGNIGNKSGYCRYYSSHPFTDEEKEGAKKMIE